MDKPNISGNTITIPSSQDFLADVDNFVEDYLENQKVSRSVIADIAICVTEIVINGIVHGNQSDPGKRVKVSVNKNNSKVEITITDEGGGFNPDTIENPIEEKNLLKEVGRGVFIVKSLMDEVDIKACPEGTLVILRKNLA